MNAETASRFFRRRDWASFWTGTAVSFLVYFFTCAPSVTLEDCGELAVAGDYMGVPHPPGYPSWTVCAWFFARLLSWVTFRGQPNPAWAIAVMSAFWGALATGLAAMLVSRSAADLLSLRRRAAEPGDPGAGRFVPVACWAAGSASALVFAFSPVMWSQSTIVEVYSFNAFFLMLVLLLAYRWMKRPTARLLVLTAFLFGLGVTNYQVLLFALVPLVLIVLLQDAALFRDFALVGVPAVALVLFMSLGAKPGQPGFEKHVPLSPTGLADGSSAPLLACNAGDELPVGGTPNFFQGEWIDVRTPFGTPSGGIDPKTGRPRGEIERDAKGEPRIFRTADGTPYLKPLYRFTTYPGTTDAEALVEALRRDVAADAGGLSGAALDAEIARRVSAGKLDSADSIRARFSTAENGRYRRAERATRLTAAAAVLFALLFAGAAGFLGRRARLGAAGPVPAPALAVLAGSGLALAVVCFGVLPAAPALPGTERLAADELFGWFRGPLLGLLSPGAEIVLLLAATWTLALFVRGGFWFAAGATGVLAPMAVFLAKGALLGLTHPLNPCFAVYVLAGAALLALAWTSLENGRLVVLAVLAAGLGVGGYLLMPVLGDSCPPMNWGYPRTWEGFKHAITRGQYEALFMSSPFTADFIHKFAFYFQDVRAQFTMLLAPFALVPFAAWKLRLRDGRRLDTLGPACLAALAIAGLAVLDRLLPSVSFQSWRLAPDKLLFGALGLAALVGAHVSAVREIAPLLRRAADAGLPPSRRLVSGLAGAALVLAAAGVALGFLNAVAEFSLDALWGLADPGDALPETDPGHAARAAAIAAYVWPDWLLTGLLFAAWIAAVGFLASDFLRAGGSAGADGGGEDGAPALDPAMPALAGRWLIATLVCFLMMSVMVIAWANPRGDIQDNFIQKVKFISSHGIYSLWIGYGLALALCWGRSFARRAAPGAVSALAALAVAAALATPLLPVNENYNNFRLVDETSAADQNGHEFGWQFGSWQLRGAPSIAEELGEDEEPLPDPTYPKPMTQDAVFFGGTDPGRFVPTYMIYSAMVRPDVYLITQNALADSTYLDTMRGISREGEGVQGVYSDQIWMPTVDDNRRAFQRYTDDVQSGRRPDIGGITRTPDGRVSVNGALAVMQINGIIAEDIFRKNRDKHDFYVEESYAMEWMYPYLVPNGLIMRVQHDPDWKEGGAPVRYPEAVAVADMDFWDWYSRRLVADPKFGRDIPARKSFNKLRSALAGTYAKRGDRARAERAWNQALSLYVYSPETVMSLVQSVYLAQGRTEGPVELLEQLHALDPNNVKIPLDDVRRITAAMRDLRELGARLAYAPDSLSAAERIRLAEASLELGHGESAARAVVGADGRTPALQGADLLEAAVLFSDMGQPAAAAKLFKFVPAAAFSAPETPAAVLVKAYDAHLAARDAAAAHRVLALYLARERNDWARWIDFASLSEALGNRPAAIQALANALRTGGDEARAAAGRRPELFNLAEGLSRAGASVSGAGLVPAAPPAAVPGPQQPVR